MIFEEGYNLENDYINEDAAEMILENIPNEMREKFDFDDIMLILNIIEDYYEILELKDAENTVENKVIPPELGAPVDLDEEELKYHIIKNAAGNGLILTEEELAEILYAELLYLDDIGWLKEREALYN
jgi:hypothetical protein